RLVVRSARPCAARAAGDGQRTGDRGVRTARGGDADAGDRGRNARDDRRRAAGISGDRTGARDSVACAGDVAGAGLSARPAAGPMLRRAGAVAGRACRPRRAWLDRGRGGGAAVADDTGNDPRRAAGDRGGGDGAAVRAWRHAAGRGTVERDDRRTRPRAVPVRRRPCRQGAGPRFGCPAPENPVGRRPRRRYRLQQPLHRGARQLPARLDRRGGAGPGRSAQGRLQDDGLRHRRQWRDEGEGVARHLGIGPGHRRGGGDRNRRHARRPHGSAIPRRPHPHRRRL
ncbi:hypothetical protein LTR94_028581, partial [Friedmanniomyces endolithicus]